MANIRPRFPLAVISACLPSGGGGDEKGGARVGVPPLQVAEKACVQTG